MVYHRSGQVPSIPEVDESTLIEPLIALVIRKGFTIQSLPRCPGLNKPAGNSWIVAKFRA